jgi:hypothetical protein
MTAEDIIDSNENLPEISAELGKTITIIVQAVKSSCAPFKKATRQSNLIFPLNENKLTQIFVEQVEVQIKSQPFIGVKNQYSDLFHGTKGIPDFYFHAVEEGVIHEPLFVVESKRLPSPNFEKEYVIGENRNGGIERFKIEKHGKGLPQCGLLGFVEKHTSEYWFKTINSWILELSRTDSCWTKNEVLEIKESMPNYLYSISTAQRISSEGVFLHHFWIV